MVGSRMCSSIHKAQLLCCRGLEGFDQLLVMERASWHHSGLVWFLLLLVVLVCFPCGSGIKNLPANAGDMGSIPGSGRSPGGGNGNPLQYSCLGNTMDREPEGLQSRESQKNWTWLSDFTSLHGYYMKQSSMNSRVLKKVSWISQQDFAAPL